MIQSIYEALSGFSVVLFTVFVAVLFTAITLVAVGGTILGFLWISRQGMKEVSLPAKLATTVVKRERKSKPGLVKEFKQKTK